MPLALSRQIRRPAGVSSRELDGETVLLDLGSAQYFGLNETGSVVWQALGEGPTTIGAVRARLLREFDVDEQVLDADLAELLEVLETRGLIVTDPPVQP